MITEYVVKVDARQSRDLWLSEDGHCTEHFNLAARFEFASTATLEAVRSLPYSFEVIPTVGAETESEEV